MKRIIGTILITVLLCGMAGIAYAQTWQESLENAGFNVVETFDNLADWRAKKTVYEPNYNLEDLPKKIDGSPSHWSFYKWGIEPPWDQILKSREGEENIKFIANHGEYSLRDGKSLCLSYGNFCEYDKINFDFRREFFYAGGTMGMYLGTPGDDTVGYKELYIFYMLKFRFEEKSLTGGSYKWTKSKNGIDEYYLDVDNPGHFCANTLIINGKRISHGRIRPFNLDTTAAIDLGNNLVRLTMPRLSAEHFSLLQTGDPVTIHGSINYDGFYLIKNVAENGKYIDIEHPFVPETFTGKEIIGVSLGYLGPDFWSYGDNDDLGYYTIYVRLEGDTEEEKNPNNKGENYIKYEAGFYTLYQRDPPKYYYGCNAKHLTISSGFWDSKWWHGNQGGNGCLAQEKTAYGAQFTMFNWVSGSIGISINDATFVCRYNDVDSCYDNTYGKTFSGETIYGRYWNIGKQGFDMPKMYVDKKWIGMEYRLKIGTKDHYDGETEVWIYDEDGNVLYNEAKIDENHLTIFPDHKYNRILFGTNKVNSSYSFLDDDSWDNRYYIDDFILDDQRIAPTYFALLNNQPFVTTASLSEAIANQSYSQNLQASGGTMPYTWKIISGSLPQGLTLNENTGEISGVPVNEGLWIFTIEVTDAGSKTASRELSLTVTATGITGDINADGIVNVLDLQLCVNVVLGIETDADRVKKANVNGDGGVDVLDIQAVVNVILNSV